MCRRGTTPRPEHRSQSTMRRSLHGRVLLGLAEHATPHRRGRQPCPRSGAGGSLGHAALNAEITRAAPGESSDPKPPSCRGNSCRFDPGVGTTGGGAVLDLLVHNAGADDLYAVDQVALLVAARDHARPAGPDHAAAPLEVGDEPGERVERRHVGQLLPAAPDQVDGGAGQEDRDLQAGGDPAVGDREGDRGELGVDAPGPQDQEAPTRTACLSSL